MAGRFVIGRAGSGKTARMLEAVRAELSRSAWGPRLILLVPEQSTFQVERVLLETGGLPGFLRAEVLSFRRLARRVLAGAGGPLLADLTEPGRAMLLRRILSEGTFPSFGPIAGRPGVVSRIARTIGEFQRECVTPADLRALVAGAIDPSSPLGRKLADLGGILEAYLAALEGKRLDPDALIDRLRRAIASCEWLRGARIWVDGFAGFTRSERRALVELARIAESVELSLLADPGAPVFARRVAAEDELCLFHRTEKTYVRLREDFAEAGLAIEPIVALAPPVPHRFRGAPDLAHIERHLFGSGSAPRRRHPRSKSGPSPPAATRSRPPPARSCASCENAGIDSAISRSRRATWDPTTMRSRRSSQSTRFRASSIGAGRRRTTCSSNSCEGSWRSSRPIRRSTRGGDS